MGQYEDEQQNTRHSECQSQSKTCLKDTKLRLPASIAIVAVLMAIIDKPQDCVIYF